MSICKMHSKNENRLRNQRGQSLIEYLVIVALVAVGGIGIMRTVGESVNKNFAHIAKSLGADVDGKIDRAKVTSSQYSRKSLRNFMNDSSKSTDKNQDNDNDSQ